MNAQTRTNSFEKSCEKTHFGLVGTKSEARDDECMRDANQLKERENGWRALAKIPQAE